MDMNTIIQIIGVTGALFVTATNVYLSRKYRNLVKYLDPVTRLLDAHAGYLDEIDLEGDFLDYVTKKDPTLFSDLARLEGKV